MTDFQSSFNEPSEEALFRYQVLSRIFAREHRGEKRSLTIKDVAGEDHITANGKSRTICSRTLYRWLDLFETHGFSGLIPKQRAPLQGSQALPPKLIEFFVNQKTADPSTSVPEIIRRAEMKGIISTIQDVNRVTAWRTLKRMGVDVSRRKTSEHPDRRRFSYPHRMQMVLCDGKHFRAGPGRLRRVALFFLDDSSRMGLHVVVGSSENAELFLRGLYETILSYGFMDAIFVDNGSGFTAHDSIEVLRKLNILFIHGTSGYPEGHGKIERFNRTVKEQAIRLFNGNPEIDPECSALELRLRHYLHQRYNLSPHESLDKNCPWSCFHDDKKAPYFPESQDHLRQAFILHTKRRVSKDNVVALGGVYYEVVRGYAGARVLLHRNMLDHSVSIIHQGRLVRLTVLDPHINARAKRSKTRLRKEQGDVFLPKSSAQLAFDQDMRPIVEPDGGFIRPPNPFLKEEQT